MLQRNASKFAIFILCIRKPTYFSYRLRRNLFISKGVNVLHFQNDSSESDFNRNKKNPSRNLSFSFQVIEGQLFSAIVMTKKIAFKVQDLEMELLVAPPTFILDQIIQIPKMVKIIKQKIMKKFSTLVEPTVSFFFLQNFFILNFLVLKLTRPLVVKFLKTKKKRKRNMSI